MARMLRKQIYITRRQQEQLKRLAKAHGVGQAEVIRQAIERELLLAAAQSRVGDRSALEEFLRFGSSRCVTNAIAYTWTRDELYDDRLSCYGRADS